MASCAHGPAAAPTKASSSLWPLWPWWAVFSPTYVLFCRF